VAPLSERFSALERHFRERNQMAQEWELQMRWIVCPSCGAQAWVLPPHGLDSCPLAIQAMEQLGLKFDAERMAAIRTGIGVEEIARVAREMRGGE
jgi:hypothetical protein